jgi:FkbM family methyltransferase
MDRVFRIFGQPTTISDYEGSQYLADRSADFEQDTLSVFAAFCEPDFNVLDIGANIGLTAIALGRLCSRGEVFAIEASPETFEYLKVNLARAELANVTCENMAAAAAAGELTIAVDPSFSAGGFISQRFPVSDPQFRHYPVRARTVDEYLTTMGVDQVHFIKADVEGFELEVLRGARQTLERSRPVIFCEVNHSCLSNLQGVSLPEFIAEMFKFFPHVFAINSDLRYLELSDQAQLRLFCHEHTTRLAYMNLVCGFDRDRLATGLAGLSRIIGTAPAEIARVYKPHPVQAVAAYCRRQLRAVKRSWKSAA